MTHRQATDIARLFRMAALKVVALSACAASLGACLDVADERARFDLEVGRGAIPEAAVEVRDGLASVQSFEPGALVLWAQAPELEITLITGPQGGGSWLLTLHNALADAAVKRAVVVDQPGGAGQSAEIALDVEPVEPASPLVTLKSWRLELPSGATIKLTIGPPDARSTEPFRFMIFADIQSRIDGVQDMYDRMKEDPTIRFGLISGDLTEQGAPEELRAFQDEMRALPFPLYATLGNHELGHGQHVFQRIFGRGNFSFVFRGVRFTLLDSASATIAPQAYDWLDDWLDDAEGGLHLVVTHIPPLDPAGQRNGAFASRGEANRLLSLLARKGVDMTVYGHVHSFYTFTNAGIEAFISGGGGAIPQRLDGIGRHYLTVDADPVAQRFATSVVRIDPED